LRKAYTRKKSWIAEIAVIAAIGVTAMLAAPPLAAGNDRPSVLVITVDALRADHLGIYGYSRPTSPTIDRLMSEGLLFERAWTPEPLTGPAMCSMLTGLPPHQHAATRNGLRMEAGLDSLPKTLAGKGWSTAGFIGAWTLKNNLTLLGDHFETYGERLRRRRWFGVINSEASGEDLTDDALEWAERHHEKDPGRPFFLWVHYIEPHAPYRFHKEYAKRLGVNEDKLTRVDRYDTEIAAVDESIRRLLEGIKKLVADDNLLIVFTADHGESLGDHNYWGHGRYLYEPSLRIPLGIVWKGRIRPGATSSQATLLDLAPTLYDLVGVAAPGELAGRSWESAARGGEAPPERAHCYQAHRGAVHGGTHDNDQKRSKGLLAVGVIDGGRKEILRIMGSEHLSFDLAEDPLELDNLVTIDSSPSEALLECLGSVSQALGALDRLATQKLDDETVEQLKALGYLE
jgi:arylsulfatase A-like enzyme